MIPWTKKNLSAFRLLFVLMLGLTGALQAAAPTASARVDSMPIIRDAEIETVIRSWTGPLAKAANLDPASLHIHIVKNPKINAFVTGGNRIFLTTGLLMRAGKAEAVIGVIAHELGHIAGGHIVRLHGARQDAADQAMLGVLTGIAVTMLGQPGAGMAISAKAQEIGLQSLTRHTRTQERSADRVAVDLLKRTETSTQGLLKLLEDLQRQEFLVQSARDTYFRTHPMTRERITFMRKHEAFQGNKRTEQTRAAQYDRILAKLAGFLNTPQKTLRSLSPHDRSIKTRYTRAIALYRNHRIDKALEEIDGLLDEFPEDPYFWELRGQMLFENGRIKDAVPSYQKALDLKPDEPLLLVELAHAQIELGTSAMLDKALANLEELVRRDRLLPLAWQLAAIAYGRTKRFGMAALAQAENELLRGQLKHAREQAAKARHFLPKDSPGHLRAQDILQLTDKKLRK